MRLEYGFSQGERGRSYGEIQGRTPNRLLTKTGQPCTEFLHPRYATYSIAAPTAIPISKLTTNTSRLLSTDPMLVLG